MKAALKYDCWALQQRFVITKRRRQNKFFVFLFFAAILLDFSLTDIEVGFALMLRCIWSEIALGVA